MKRIAYLTLFVVCGLAVAATPKLISRSVVSAGPTQTGQGIMVNLDAQGTFAIVSNDFYQYDETTAASYFTNVWNGNAPTVSCSGPGCTSTSTPPVAPSAPAPDAGKVTGPTGAVKTQKCIFLDGGTLSGSTYTKTDQTIQGSGSSKKTWTFTYTYNVTPTANPVTAFTAWNYVGSTGDSTAHISIGAEIAGESVISSAKFDKKYSFSLRDDLGESRVTNLVVTVDGIPYNATSQLVENCPGCLFGDPGSVDFAYTTNAGTNGVASLLTDGDARTLLNSDSFAGNQNGGTDGRALAKAVMDAVEVALGPGDHTVTLTGSVKGNTATSANVDFTVTQTIHVIAPGCSGNN